MASAPMIVPLGRWTKALSGNRRAKFAGPITAATADDTHVVTGLRDGRVWIYSRGRNDPFHLTFKVLCLGHRTAVTTLTLVEVETDAPSRTEMVVISASEDGVLMKWALADGRCLQCNPKILTGTPTRLAVFPDYLKLHSSARFIVCSGKSDDITILNAASLEIVRVWSGHSNWVTCSPIPDAAQNRLLTCTVSGELGLWSFDEGGSHAVHEEPLYAPPRMLSEAGFISALLHASESKGRVAAVGTKAIVVFSVNGDKAEPLFRILAPQQGVSWAGAIMVSKSQLLAWIDCGNIYEFYLPAASGAVADLLPTRLLLNPHADATYSNTVFVIPSPPHLNLMNENGVPPEVFLFANLTSGPRVIGWVLPRHDVEGNKALGSIEVEMSDPKNDRELMASWPFQSEKEGEGDITAAIVIGEALLVLGHENGDIFVTNMSAILSGDADEPKRLVLQNHRRAVTILLALDPLLLAGKQYLLSGGADYAINVWNLDTGDLLASFKPHMDTVLSFVQPPIDAGLRMKGCVLSVARDNSVAVISVDELNCLYIFPGHSSPLSVIQWRSTEDYIAFGYEDGSLFVWQMKTAHLDRIETGPNALEIIQSSTCSVRVDRHGTSRREKIEKSVISLSPVFIDDEDIPFLHVLLVNNKRLVDDTHRKHRRIPPSNHANKNGSGVTSSPQNEETSNTSPVSSPTASTHKETSGEPNGWTFEKSETDETEGLCTPPRKSSGAPEEASNPCFPADSSTSQAPFAVSADLSVAQTVLSALLSWGLNAQLDLCCSNTIMLRRKDELLTFGLRGANGNISLLAPVRGRPAEDWCVSHHVTSSRLLALVSLAKALIYAIEVPESSDLLVKSYTTKLAELVGDSYMHPSLSYLAKYWLDTSVDTQKASRRVVSSTLMQLSDDKKKAIVAHWQTYLPAATSQTATSKSMARSAIVLGIIGSENPSLLPPRACKNVALSLTLLLNENHRTSYQLAAIELCAKGFATWEPHFNAAAVIRTLLALSSDSGCSPFQMKNAQRALVQIGTVNVTLFVSTIAFDLVHSKLAVDKITILKIISYFICKNRRALYPLLPKVVEAVVKSLDPNIHNMRESILKTATGTLHNLVKYFPCVSFHGGSQRLAVGTLEGATVLYDLRTATRWHVLEGHAKPVTAVTFSADGRAVASCSLEESSLKVWHPNAGILGIIAGSMHAGTANPFSSTTTKPYKAFSLNQPGGTLPPENYPAQVRLEWHTEHTLSLRFSKSVLKFNV